MRGNISKFLLGALIYIYLYNPVLKWPGVSLMLFVYPIALLYATSHYSLLKRYIKYNNTGIIISVLLFVWVYYKTIMSGGDDRQTAYQLLMWLSFTTLLVPFFLVESILKKEKGISFFDTILNVGFVASVISVLCAAFPPLNDFITDIQIDIEAEGFLSRQLGFRNFGLASGLTNTYGYVQGTLAAICILRMEKRKFRYYVYFITLTISAAINARTGLFPIMITLGYKAILSILKMKFSNIITMGIFAFFFIGLITQLRVLFPDQAEFVANFFDGLNSIYSSKEETVYESMWFLPKTTSGLIFGEGRVLMGMKNVYGYGSDIGYVNQVFIGGLIFAVGLLIYILLMYKQMWKKSGNEVLPLILLISSLIFNYKGYAFYATSGFNRFVMLYYFVILYNYMASRKLKSCIRL